MCGIVGAASTRNVVDLLIEGIRKLEYRGYDSTGIAFLADGRLQRLRSTGRVAHLDELARLCVPGAVLDRKERAACGPLRPYKWYVAAYRGDRDDPRWTKAIAVLTERNWIAATGRIHGAGDHGPNPAAEIAMQIAARHVGMLEWKDP